MKNIFPYTNDNKRYHTLNYELQKKFHSKVFKVSLNAGFSCPNIDGTVGTKGCTYCSNMGSGEFAGNQKDNLITQFHQIKNKISKKWPNSKYIGYFQAHTNTYAEVPILKEKYESILNEKNVIGLSIATRSDAITEECLDYLEKLNKKTYLTIELGLQTIHETTSKKINRCHTLENFEQMVQKLRERNIQVVVHIINGLPYETKQMMLETIKYLNTLDIQGIKIHMLHIIQNTQMALEYKKNPFPILTQEQYVDIVCDQLEYLRPEIVIHRITGDPKAEDLIEPQWLTKKFTVLNDIDKELERRQAYQGFKLNIDHKIKQYIRKCLKENDYVIIHTTHQEINHIINDKINKNHILSLQSDLKPYQNKISSIIIDEKTLEKYSLNNLYKLLNNKGFIIIIMTNPKKTVISLPNYITEYHLENSKEYLIIINKQTNNL